MTQPPNPGQPFYQQQPSAPSAPATGQPYPPQQQFQGAPGAPGAPGQPYPPAASGDSLVGSLFDTSKEFVTKYSRIVFIVASIAVGLGWLGVGYMGGKMGAVASAISDPRNYDGSTFDAMSFLMSLVFSAPAYLTVLFVIRLFIELVSNSSKSGPQA
ncbi:collagen-like protein [Actinomyces viscosus]|uniref:collagen-like protein n=1 Tax=Actinomyces viscosus TaxID=1656 RepID=UPI00106FCC85|nr:collagen-like protein [Actinomyces viscosus]TFH53308.1 collagen-like protein [Actinomyces viscosus]